MECNRLTGPRDEGRDVTRAVAVWTIDLELAGWR